MPRKSTSTTTTVGARRYASTATIGGGDCQRPREATLAFLRQFARAYHYEPVLAPSHAAMVLN